MSLFFIFEVVACLLFLSLVIGLVCLFLVSQAYPNLDRFDAEKYFLDPQATKKQQKFPSLNDKHSVQLSVIVPSYNEQDRLPTMLDECIGFLEKRRSSDPEKTFEIIVVDDGSKDKTSKVALDYSIKYGCDKVRVLTLVKNRGKGGAVRLGMFSARGKSLLFADADGATSFPDLVKLEESLNEITNKDGMGVVCGSRAHLEEESVASRSFMRTVLMYGFHFLVWFLCVRGIKDTQCGFKLLTRPAALLLFSNLHVERWAFDVDMLYLAQYFNIPISEVAVNWQEIEGSKMIPIFSWAQMGKDLLLIRLRYLIGAWKINPKIKAD
ncbi:dolichyl-phosphate beta-glucosyltransferase-like [Tubulanus polymorphus]|uniref:dolichyl-phosphate beta-glucosyltransferase-like n=1 Tax=Tubulanus polymorphus TaxID=672921 RepID=UPI003DA6C363